MNRTPKTCKNCGKQFLALTRDVKRGYGKFCSRKCHSTSMVHGVDEFWSQVEKGEGCWVWLGSKMADGYGSARRNSKTVLAHRLSYELTFGPIPDGLMVCHTCDNKPCVRPDHFFLGTCRDNIQDASRKGRLACGERGGMQFSPTRKLSKEDVVSIRSEYVPRVVTIKELARQYNVSPRTIRAVVAHENWKWVSNG